VNGTDRNGHATNPGTVTGGVQIPLEGLLHLAQGTVPGRGNIALSNPAIAARGAIARDLMSQIEGLYPRAYGRPHPGWITTRSKEETIRTNEEIARLVAERDLLMTIRAQNIAKTYSLTAPYGPNGWPVNNAALGGQEVARTLRPGRTTRDIRWFLRLSTWNTFSGQSDAWSRE
jgi:hypothetical protein